MKDNKKNTIPVNWARWGVVSSFLARKLKTAAPPILVFSLPRSGSSWVGEILGNASNALYLREPMTQSNLALNKSQPAEIYIDPIEPLQTYQRFADMTFNGIPIFHKGIVIYPKQWSLLERKNRRLVIKEVNPLACDWLIQRYKPRVIFLVRHPVAVALSYLKLGWINTNIKSMFFSNQRLIRCSLKQWEKHLMSITSDFWERQGAMQGAVLRFALESLKTYSDYKIILYEDLCSNPVEIFQGLFDFSSLFWSEETQKLTIERSSGSDKSQPYSTSRSSKNMIDSWREKLSYEELNRLKNAYCVFDLPWYKSSCDW